MGWIWTLSMQFTMQFAVAPTIERVQGKIILGLSDECMG